MEGAPAKRKRRVTPGDTVEPVQTSGVHSPVEPRVEKPGSLTWVV